MVQGVIRNAATGAPLARALVEIEGDAETGTLTDGEGRFEIPGVPVGPQTLRLVKPGFRDRPYPTEESGLQAEGPAHSVMIAAEMPDLDFALQPNCAIHGRIELSTGDPADSISLNLLRRVVHMGRGIWVQEASTRTNGDGNYRFGGLPDGVYVVYTQPALESEPVVSVVATGSAANVARNGYASVFYPDARALSGAQQIRVAAGGQAEANFSLTLEPFYPVTTASAAETRQDAAGNASPPQGFTAVIGDAQDHLLPYTAQYDDATHSLQANLPDGTYVLTVRGNQRPQLQGGVFPLSGRDSRAAALAGQVEFTVAGHPVTGLRIPIGPPQQAAIRLRLLHNADRPPTGAFAANNASQFVNLNIELAEGIPQNSFDTIWSMESGPDAIAFTAQPGAYWVTASPSRRDLCAASFTAGGLNLAREPLLLSLAAAPPPMELSLTDDCATLALSLPPGLAAFLPGEEPFYTVYLVPDLDTGQDIPPMTLHPSSGPTLNLDGLTPGNYRVYTFLTPVHLEYRNPAVMAALGVPGQQVTLSAGTTATLMLEVPEH
ncbi:MAG: carboxypeptidase-like regulatory domain-containing protein [Terracidiphilus sp.]|nr:carboxypeptidase-like regulatory domain-containing protein [Terracidiphilus sp.]